MLDSDHDSTTGPNPSAQPLLHSPPSPPHSQVNPAVNLEMTTPSAPHATPHAHDAVHEDDVVAPTKEVKMYAPVKPEVLFICLFLFDGRFQKNKIGYVS